MKEIPFTRAEEIKRTSAFTNVQRNLEGMGLSMDIIEYRHHPLQRTPYSGTYMVISPSTKHLTDLKNNPTYIEELLKMKGSKSSATFNPNYLIYDMSKYDNRDCFRFTTQTIRDAQIQANFITAIRENGLPTIPNEVSAYAVYEIIRLRDYAHNEALDKKVRDRYKKSYKEYVGHIYQRYTDKKDLQIKGIHNGKVDKDFFMDNHIPCMFNQVNEQFRGYLESRAKAFPDFFYYIEEKPSLKLKDLSNFGGIWKKEKGVTEYQCCFPTSKEHIFYKIMMEYNMSSYRGQVKSLDALDPFGNYQKHLVCVADMWNIDSLCKANNVPYYLNHGEIEKFTHENTDKILMFIRNDDEEKLHSIFKRLMRESVQSQGITAQEGLDNAIYTQGKEVKNGEHTRCIQAWLEDMEMGR